ncbi:MAG TPA: hypothetical protein VEB43_03935 [Anaeromyxobacter sp.]|nr:hypothetical protein [Anaeromyxobacter sp.]
MASAVVLGILLGWDLRAALPIGLLLVYPNLATGLDRTVITVRDGWLRVVNRPLPWPLGGSVRLADIQELRLRLTRIGEGYDNGGATIREGDMFVRLRNGREKKLLTDQASFRLGTQRIKWVMHELRRELESGRWTRS